MWSNGAVHHGKFVNGVPNGYGRRTYAGAKQGEIAEGNFLNW